MSYLITNGKGMLIAEIDVETLRKIFKLIRSKKSRHRKKLLKKIIQASVRKLAEE